MYLSYSYRLAWDYSHGDDPRIPKSSKKRQTAIHKLFSKLGLHHVCSCPISPNMSHNEVQNHYERLWILGTRNCQRPCHHCSCLPQQRWNGPHERPRVGEKKEHNARMALEVGRKSLSWGSLFLMASLYFLKWELCHLSHGYNWSKGMKGD